MMTEYKFVNELILLYSNHLHLAIAKWKCVFSLIPYNPTA